MQPVIKQNKSRARTVDGDDIELEPEVPFDLEVGFVLEAALDDD